MTPFSKNPQVILDGADRILGVLQKVTCDDEVVAFVFLASKHLAVIDHVDRDKRSVDQLRVLVP